MADLQISTIAVSPSVVTCVSEAALANEPNRNHLLGTWTLTKVPDSSEISSIGDAEVAARIGKKLVIAPNNITVAGKSCRKPPKFARHYEDAAKYV